MAARIKACWRCLQKQHGRNPGSVKCRYHLLCIPSSCKHNHPSDLSFIFPVSISKGEVETWMLQCDLPQATTFSLLFTSPQLFSGEEFGAARPKSCHQSRTAAPACRVNQQLFPPKRLLGELGQLHKAAAAQES